MTCEVLEIYNCRLECAAAEKAALDRGNNGDAEDLSGDLIDLDAKLLTARPSTSRGALLQLEEALLLLKGCSLSPGLEYAEDELLRVVEALRIDQAFSETLRRLGNARAVMNREGRDASWTQLVDRAYEFFSELEGTAKPAAPKAHGESPRATAINSDGTSFDQADFARALRAFEQVNGVQGTLALGRDGTVYVVPLDKIDLASIDQHERQPGSRLV